MIDEFKDKLKSFGYECILNEINSSHERNFPLRLNERASTTARTNTRLVHFFYVQNYWDIDYFLDTFYEALKSHAKTTWYPVTVLLNPKVMLDEKSHAILFYADDYQGREYKSNITEILNEMSVTIDDVRSFPRFSNLSREAMLYFGR